MFIKWPLLASFALVAADARIFDKGAKAPPVTNPTNFIVVYRPGVDMTSMVGARRWAQMALNATTRRTNLAPNLGFSMDLLDLSKYPTGASDAAAILARHPMVQLVERDQQVTVQLQTQTNPPSWGLDRVDQRQLPLNNQFQYDDQAGAGTTVYVVDTGVKVDNPEFEGRAVWGVDFTGEGFYDGDGHGTHCAGTVGGKSYGVAKKASIVAVKVLDSTGSGTWSGVISGVNWVATNCTTGARCVMSMSLGGGYSLAVNMAVQNAYSRGVVPVVAAGNENMDACWTSPASTSVALTVAASDINDQRAWFSNQGFCVDLFAPGVDITSVTTCDGGQTDCLGTWSGTSMATPHVAGIAALVWTRESAQLRTPLQVVTRIKTLGTRGVLKSLRVMTPNLLAYSGV